MKNETIEKEIRREVKKITPDVWSKVEEKINIKRNKRFKFFRFGFKQMAALAAAVAILLTGTIVALANQNQDVYSFVAIDVNPSIELKINQNDKVVEVTGINEDAQNLIEGLDLENKALENATQKIFEKLVQNGYLNQETNSVLLTFESEKQENQQRLENQMRKYVENSLSNQSFVASVMTQNYKHDEVVRQLKEEYEISLAKACLIQKIIEQDQTLLAADLAELKINALNLIIQEEQIEFEDLDVRGQASKLEYLTQEQIEDLIEDNLLVNLSGVEFEVHLVATGGNVVYSVTLSIAGIEHSYKINAITGQIINNQIQGNNPGNGNQN